MYQWSKALGGGKKTSNQSHTIQWQSTVNKQLSPSQPQLRQQQKQQEMQRGKHKDNKQKSSSLSLLYRRLQQQEKQMRLSSSTESGGSSTTTPPPPLTAAPAFATPRRRGRVIRAIDILLGPTDSDGSSINHERVRQHSMNSPFHTQPPSQSGSSTSLSVSLLPQQGDASIAGGRCMIPAIDLHKMGSSSTSATF
jgi:hypothetical protein